jgi:glycosyltransferase involved in cell wall biosynthesis
MITVGIPTKNRYDALSHTLLSIALQTMTPYEVIIVDDNDAPVNLTTNLIYEYIFRLFDDKGIKWKVLFGEKKGQHFSHQMVQEAATTDFIFRVDDDCILEPDVLRKLLSVIKRPGVGAVAPAVLMPNPAPLPLGYKNLIKSIDKPNSQWYKGTGISYAEHLYSCFIYRKGLAKYDLNLSTVAHREETIFSHSIFRADYQLFVNHDAQVWHFRQNTGGIRTFQHDPSLWEHDEKIFQSYMNLWNASKEDTKYIILDNGLGDHYAFKHILPKLREKNEKIVIACCYPDVFHDEDDIELMSIAQAKLIFGNIDNHNIYRYMIDHNWKGTLVEAFEKLYL